MKIPSSSSLFFASLAISSSSSALAAPAGEPPASEAGMTSSPSGHHVAARRDSTATRGLGSAELDARAAAAELEARGGLLGGVLCPFVSPVQKLVCGDAARAMQAAQSSDPQSDIPTMSKAEAIESLQVAIAALSMHAMAQEPAGQDPSDEESDDYPSSSSTTTTSDASASTTANSSSLAGSDYTTSATASPSIPTNPPNTPAMSSTASSDTPARRNVPLKVVAVVPDEVASLILNGIVSKVPGVEGAAGMVLGTATSLVGGVPAAAASRAPSPVAGTIPSPAAAAPDTAAKVVFPVAGSGVNTIEGDVGKLVGTLH